MNFVSLDFLFFIAFVLPVFYALPDRFKNIFLVAASYFFYAYWSVWYLLLLVLIMICDYYLALRIDSEKNPRLRTTFLIVSLTVNLGVLFAFKYLDFFFSLVSQLFHRPMPKLNLPLPFGISFYVFHTLSYIFDVYRGIIRAERNYTYYSGYVMFFPQLVAGPIARASHLLHQFKGLKRFKPENFTQGGYWIARGFVFKVILADHLAPMVGAVFERTVAWTPLLVIQAIYLFTFQIYFDFSGYTDIARGLAKIMDFDLIVNFRYPFKSATVTEFWTRWHISFTTWIRDYVYNPLSMGAIRSSKNYLLFPIILFTLLLSGLWHGANLTFVVWGLMNGLFICLESVLMRHPRGRLIHNAIPHGFKVLFTFHLICFTEIFFRSQSLTEAVDIMGSLAKIFQYLQGVSLEELFQYKRLWLLIGGALLFEWAEERFLLFEKYQRFPRSVHIGLSYVLVAIVILFAETNPNGFIYFQF